jgi:hypothetical protein
LDGPEHPTAPCFSFGDDQVYNDIWYSFTADFNGFVEWSTCGSVEFDSRLAVYQASGQCPVEDTDLLACNDDGPGCSNFTSYLIFPVSIGETYLLRLGGYANGDMGVGTFNLLEVTPPPVPDNDNCDNVQPATIVSESDADAGLGWIEGTTIGASLSGEIPGCAINGAGEFQDVWFSFNSGAESALEIRMQSLSENAEFILDFFQICDSPVVDTENGGDFYQQCYSQGDVDVFNGGIIEVGEMETDTDYLMRVSTQITYFPVGDFRFQLVRTSAAALDEPESASITVFPNPARDIVSIVSVDSIIRRVWIRDLGGRLVKEFAGSGQNKLLSMDISDLPEGVYMLETFDQQGSRSTVSPIVVQ